MMLQTIQTCTERANTQSGAFTKCYRSVSRKGRLFQFRYTILFFLLLIRLLFMICWLRNNRVSNNFQWKQCICTCFRRNNSMAGPNFVRSNKSWSFTCEKNLYNKKSIVSSNFICLFIYRFYLESSLDVVGKMRLFLLKTPLVFDGIFFKYVNGIRMKYKLNRRSDEHFVVQFYYTFRNTRYPHVVDKQSKNLAKSYLTFSTSLLWRTQCSSSVYSFRFRTFPLTFFSFGK